MIKNRKHALHMICENIETHFTHETCENMKTLGTYLLSHNTLLGSLHESSLCSLMRHNTLCYSVAQCCRSLQCLCFFLSFFGIEWNASLLRWGWVFLKRTRTLSGIQFTRHFIDFIVVKTKQNVGSDVNVIMTRQTCGQRSSRAAWSKRRAPENYFSERIYHMFLISKCRGEWNLGLCTFWELAKREPLCSGDFWKKTCFARGKIRIWHWAAVLFSQVPTKYTDLNLSHLYILIRGTYGKFARKNVFLAFGVCFPQPCSSVGRRFAESRSLLHHYWRIVLFP